MKIEFYSVKSVTINFKKFNEYFWNISVGQPRTYYFLFSSNQIRNFSRAGNWAAISSMPKASENENLQAFKTKVIS